MNREIAELWIADLRTNPPQAKGALFAGKGWCCLGRLCELKGVKPVARKGLDGTVYDYDGDAAVLPLSVQEWAGMHSYLGLYTAAGDDRQLAADNDSGKTFAEIADIIEAHIDEL